MFEKQQERQYDDTLQGQQGVVDNSKAMQTQAITSGIQGLAGAVDTGVDIWQTEQKQQQAQASNSALNSYGNWLEKEVQMKEQGIDPKVIDAERVKTEQQLMVDGAGRDDLLKLRKQFEGTSLGKSLTEDTPEEKAYKEDAKKAANLNMEVDEYRAFQADIYQFEYETKRRANDKASRAEAANKFIAQTTKHMSGGIARDVDSIVDMYKAGQLPRAEVENKLRRLRLNIEQQATQTALSMGGDLDKAEASVAAPLGYLDYALENFTEAGYADNVSSELKLMQDRLEIQVLSSSPNLAIANAAQGLVSNLPGVQLAITQSVADEVTALFKAGIDGDKQLSTVVINSTPASAEVMKAAGKTLNDDRVSEENKGALALGLTTAVITQLGADQPLANTKSLMELVAGEGGKALYERRDSTPGYAEYETKLKNHSLAALQKMEARLEELGPTTRGGPGEGTGNFALSLTQGGVVVFSGDTPSSRRQAQGRNREMSKAMTVFVTALANAQGITVQESFDEMFQSSEVFSQYIMPAELEKVELPAQGGGSAERMGVDLGGDEVVVEKDLGPMTMKESGDPESDARIKEIAGLLDTLGPKYNDFRYTLKRELSRLNSDVDRKAKGLKMGGGLDSLESFRPGVASELAESTTESVDWDFIQEQEGFKTNLYVPEDSDGTVVGNSGVTVGMGIDLAAWGDKLEGLGVSEGLVKKLKPYAGLRKGAAQDFLDKNPLTLTEEEAKEVSIKVKDKLLDGIKAQFNKDSESSFEDLTPQQQTVVASVFFQYGMNKSRKDWAPNFWRQVTEGDWEGAKKNLENFGDRYQKRRDRELAYLGGSQ